MSQVLSFRKLAFCNKPVISDSPFVPFTTYEANAMRGVSKLAWKIAREIFNFVRPLVNFAKLSWFFINYSNPWSGQTDTITRLLAW